MIHLVTISDKVGGIHRMTRNRWGTLTIDMI